MIFFVKNKQERETPLPLPRFTSPSFPISICANKNLSSLFIKLLFYLYKHPKFPFLNKPNGNIYIYIYFHFPPIFLNLNCKLNSMFLF